MKRIKNSQPQTKFAGSYKKKKCNTVTSPVAVTNGNNEAISPLQKQSFAEISQNRCS